MGRLPKTGGDKGTWGDILNDFLRTEHTPDGTLKIRSDGTLTKNAVGLGNVDNTSDSGKPISTAMQQALDQKVTKTALAANVKDYGAIGDGITNDTAAIQSAVDANEVVYFPTGDYLTNLVSYTGASRVLIGEGRVRLIQNDPQGVLLLVGGWDFIDTITSASINAVNLVESGEASGTSVVSQLTTAQVHSITRGDVLKIVSNDVFTGVASTGAADDYRRGEYAIAAMGSSGTSISLSHALQDTYTTLPRVGKLKNVRFVVRGLQFSTAPSLEAQMNNIYSAAITIRAAVDCELRDLIIENQYGTGILLATYNPTIENVRFRNLQNRPSIAHYGYGVIDISHGLTMSNCSGHNLRHLYTAGSNTVGAGSGQLEYFGGNQACVVSNCVCSAPQSAGFDTHELARDITFDNCIVYGSYQGANSGGNAFTARGANISFNNCVAVRCKTGFNLSTTGGALLNNCRAIKTASEAINVTGMSSFGALTTMPNIRINGGYYEAGANTGGVFSSMGSIGTSGYAASVTATGTTFALFGIASGTRLFDVRQCIFSLSDCTFDFSNISGAAAWTAFSMRDNVSSLNLARLNVQGGSSNSSGLTVVNGFSAGCTSPVDIKDLQYIHATLNPSVVGGNMQGTAWRASWVKAIGSTRTSSIDILYVPTAGGILPIANCNDQIVNVTFTGNPGNVALGAVPAGLDGQVLNISNASSGTIGCSGLPDFLIPPGGCGSFMMVGSFWRPIATTHRIFMPASAITLNNGANANVSPPGTIAKSFLRISGPTGNFSVDGINSGVNGVIMTLFNTTSQQMTITNDAPSATVANRILTLSGSDLILRTGTSFVSLIYDGTLSKWVVMSHN